MIRELQEVFDATMTVLYDLPQEYLRPSVRLAVG
jgi:hypothetical protein